MRIYLSIIFFGLSVFLIACSPAVTHEPEVPSAPAVDGVPEAPKAQITREMSNYNTDLARFIGLEIGEPMDSAVDKIKAHLNPKGESNITGTWETSDNGEGVKTFTGLADRLADDSVKAQEITTIFKKAEDGSYRLSAYGARNKCWRGDNPDQWTTNLCP